MTSGVALLVYGFMITLIFFNVVVFGTDPFIEMFYDEKDEIQDMECVELYLHAISGQREFDYAETVYNLKCVTMVNGTSFHTFERIFITSDIDIEGMLK